MSLSEKELSQLRGLAGRLGTQEAAEELHIHKTSLIRVLAGEDIRPTTVEVIREALKRGVTDVVRGETRAHSDRTKRGAR